MKQNLLKSVLLLCALIAGVTSSRANEFTFSLNELYQNGTKITAKTVIDTKGESLTFTDKNENFTILLTRNSTNQPGFYTSSGYLRFYSSDTFTLSAADGITITKVVITSNGSSFSLSSLDGLDASNKTWTGSAEKVTFTGSGTNKWDKITITYSSGSGGGGDTPTPQDCDLALTDAPIELNFDMYNNSQAQVIHYTTSSTGEVSVESGKYDVSCYVDNDQKTITVTPFAVTNGSQTVTVNQAADNTYKAGSVTFTVTVTDSTPAGDTNDETFTFSELDYENGEEITTVNGQDAILTFDQSTGSNAPKYYTTGTGARMYNGNTLTIKSDEMTIASIEFTFDGTYTSLALSEDQPGTLSNATNSVRTWEGSASSVEFTTGATNRIKSIKITYLDDPRQSPQLAFAVSEASASVGKKFAPIELTAAQGFDGTVEYESSDPLVAEITDPESGYLRIVSAGTTIITATFAGNENFRPGKASYTLTVTDTRTPTTITVEDIRLDLADIASLTKLVPVVKDADGNPIAYQCGEWPSEITFEYNMDEDTNGLIGSLDNNSGDIILNPVVGTVTMKAFYNYFNVNDSYQPSQCTFTITVYQPLNGIGEFCALDNNTIGTVKLTAAEVLYVNGKDMFVRDNTGAVNFYDTGLTYKAGDLLNGTITAKFTSYKGMSELTTPISDNNIVATAGTTPEPTAITTDYVSYNACNLVKLTDVVVTSDNGNYYVGDVQVFDKFKLNYTLEAGRAYDIVGILIPYNNIYEICPTEAPVAGELVIDEKVTLPFAWNGGVKDDLTAIEGVTAVGLGSDYAASNAPYRVKLDTNGDYIQVKTDCKPVIASLDVKMLGGATTSYITVQESADGKQFTDVEVLTIAGETSSILYLQTSEAFADDTRFVRFTFTKGSNVGLGGICIEKDLDEAVVGQEGYATYIAKHNVSFPEGVEAYIGVINKEFFTTTQVTAVPKGTPVILKNAGNFVLPAASADELSIVTSNDLIPAFEDVEADGTQYVLAKPEGQKVGFYQAETGKIPAGKAYLQSNAAVKAFFFEGEEETAINSLTPALSEGEGAIYNMAGQKLSKLQKGINIVNGKKVLF